MGFDIGDYNDVPSRMAEFREKHPEGSLQPLNLEQPYRIEIIGDRTFIVYVAAAYRSQTDARPGIGTAWEPFPGRTPYTRDSEIQNAETSAWGRAVVAALAADTKRGIASAEDVRNRTAEREMSVDDGPVAARKALSGELRKLGITPAEAAAKFAELGHGELGASVDVNTINGLRDHYRALAATQ